MIAAFCAVTAAVFAAEDSAGKEIRVPFSVQWGDSPTRVEEIMAKVKGKVVEKKTVEKRNAIVVEGLLPAPFQSAIFYFESDALNEVELRYGDSSWDSAMSLQYFEKIRRYYENKYGIGSNIVRQTSTHAESGIHQNLTGYQWSQTYTLLQLFYYTADKGPESLRVISLHFKGS